jgi:hypothetical protein
MTRILTHQQKRKVRLLMFLILLACYHNSLSVRSYLLRAALVPPSLSPWQKLYDEGDSSSFLHVTGLTREAFNSLVMIVIRLPDHSLRRRRRGLILPSAWQLWDWCWGRVDGRELWGWTWWRWTLKQERLGACQLGEDKHKGGLSIHYLITLLHRIKFRFLIHYI